MSSSYKKIDNYLTTNSDDLEKSSFVKQPNKPSKKTNYGSLRNETQAQNQTATVFIVNYRHRITSGETLQGISLKYSVPIDTIKRANRLWSNDLAFVKDFLIVPIDKEKLKLLNIDFEDTAAASSSLSPNDIQVTTNETATSSSDSPKDEYKNYLNKFDSFISESKIKLKHLEHNSNLSLSDYLTTNNKSIFNNYNYNNSEIDNDDDIFDIAKHNTTNKNSAKTSQHSSSNRTLNTSSMSSGYDSSKLSNSDTNQTLSGNGNGNLSSSSSSASNLNTLSNENVSCNSPELLIKTSRRNTKNFYGSSHNLKTSHMSNSSSRARLAQENLQRLEREKDDLYEL